ncbi:MAG: cisplatin damage response ATP-dependent DNA ligase [Hyphomicrobiaceae bacterium]|nr:cisplatin damage response ATP-dependent DNA ligase [Hyphomicrobiaceae bacterium]
MKPFAALLDSLSYTPGRNDKLRLLSDYFRATPDPDRGWALAALTDTLPFSFPIRRVLGELISARVDDQLFRLSRDYVGDTAETVALLWPDQQQVDEAPPSPPSLATVANELLLIERGALAPVLAGWLDGLDVTGRWALLKFLTGALRVGVSARLAKMAVAAAWNRPVEDIEEVWHALTPPFGALFAWLEARAPRPDTGGRPIFRPMMLAHPLADGQLDDLDLSEFTAEWKWDGIRVQVAARGPDVRLFSRTGDEIGTSFPDVTAVSWGNVVADGELLIVRDGDVAPFNDLQKRLNRKVVTPKLARDYPAHIRFYDILEHQGEDLRSLSFAERRTRLVEWLGERSPGPYDISELVPIVSREALNEIWARTRDDGIEGLMLKRRDSPYLAGRPAGHWYKWKRAPLTADCVLMYAQRGSGRRSSYFSDFTFGAWRRAADGRRELVPVGKAYSGFTDDELLELDRWVRQNGRERFGPVRAVAHELVVEVAFDAIAPSGRHKSGVAMRFPRFHRIRWDKPADEADDLDTLEAMIVR